jgi:hypothetical protein
MDAPTLLLGVIAAATGVMAAVQIGLIVYGARLARRVDRLVDQVEREIQPTLNKINSMSSDSARATSLAVAQIERADQLFAQLAQRADHLMAVAQEAVVEPVRQGVTLLQALRAGLTALRGVGESAARPEEPAARAGEDEEALFIG